MFESVFFYRERGDDPSFWAEPINAWTNLAFVLAALAAWILAGRRHARADETILLCGLAAVVGIGSFVFHTTARAITMWLDIVPIALYQIACLWLFGTRLLKWNRTTTSVMIVAVVGTSFASLPLRPWLNGSVFYLPALGALAVVGIQMARSDLRERFLILGGAIVFGVALFARTWDKSSPWSLGTHFLWHLLNGLLVYLTLRAWIVNAGNAEPGPASQQSR
ncbi:MAG: ceramidase domain-containing protein [Pirellulaceae bacterium]|nr:ceramidase domain-containing protein [Planctomycetales bacterium]